MNQELILFEEGGQYDGVAAVVAITMLINEKRWLFLVHLINIIIRSLLVFACVVICRMNRLCFQFLILALRMRSPQLFTLSSE